MNKYQVILDTDVGGDIDDIWAIGVLLSMEQIDVKLISVTSGDTEYRARVLAKLLETIGHDDIPIAVGHTWGKSGDAYPPGTWADYVLSGYKGKVYENAPQVLVDTILNSEEETIVIAIGPATNLSAAVQLNPAITTKSKIIGMFGSIRKGYNGPPSPEANVFVDLPSFKTLLFSGWKLDLVPLDSCGFIRLTNEDYQKVYRANNVFTKTLITIYEIWDKIWPWGHVKDVVDTQSSILFDIIPIYYLTNPEWFVTETVTILVDDEGLTYEEETGVSVNAVMDIIDSPFVEQFTADLLANWK